MDDPNDRLRAFCSITFESAFVIRDLKIIQGAKGSFVAMPSRKLTDRCPRCGCKNHLRASYCNQCGAHLNEDRAVKDEDGRAKLYADIAHPINSECRELIQERVLEAFESELARSREPGYVCTYDDYGEDNFATLSDDEDASNRSGHSNERSPGDTGNSRTQTVRTDGQSHRIEPAAEQGPGSPHQRGKESREPRQTASNSQNGYLQSARDDDSFGAGVV